MAALAELIRKHEPYFDIFLLAELWMEKDHNLLQEAAQDAGLYMTNYRELASRYIYYFIFCKRRVTLFWQTPYFLFLT